MRIHYLQHVPFEDLANIEVWAGEKGHEVSVTRLYMDETLPALDRFDWLIVMGGPMNIYEEVEYPWLIKEKEFIRNAINAGKFVMGICLGAQLIADVLGGKVVRNEYKEIGWFPVRKIPEASNSGLFDGLSDEFVAFHWHGDTFTIPPGAVRLAESAACQNQAFEYKGRVLGLQFHLETSKASIEKLIENCSGELVEEKYIQSAAEMLSGTDNLEKIKKQLAILLNNIEKKIKLPKS
ncbi:type 1 glutamine amidotransferase [Thermincola potens]|uniref:Glutamine amidotransferase class-I n=1 Tax=Thermincola potens (strain JR) TaxID=635013 RepID=D5XDD1_THEPJ|nr:type 1 glutamine amidotransferase [Thermincola potens]ADG81779.1 glutamine amidotransferase class-I [Thermincola potens JR]